MAAEDFVTDAKDSSKSQESGVSDTANKIKWLVTILTILSSTFLFALDNTIVADIQPEIINHFDKIENLPWLGTAFALGGTSILPWGRAYGIFNIKWLFISSVVLFEAGSAICGAAPSMAVLIFGRALAGFGGAGMYSGSLMYLAVLSTPQNRPLVMSSASITWGIGTVLGPVVGGAFAANSPTWRWAFYINLVIGGVFAPAYLFALPDIVLSPNKSFWSKCKSIDWIGMIFFFGGMVSFIMALSFGGTVYAWDSARDISLWIVSGLLLIANTLLTIYHPFVSKSQRLYPGHFVKRPVLVILQLQSFLSSGILLGVAFYIPLYFQFTRGDSAIESAVRLLPYICTLIVFSLLGGFVVSKIGYYKPIYVLGGICMTTGSGLMLLVNATTPRSNVYGFSVLTGAGIGMIMQLAYATLQALVPADEVSNAVGFISIAQDFGPAFLLGIAGSMYDSLGAENVRELIATSAPSPASLDSAGIYSLLTGTSSRAFLNLPKELKPAVAYELVDSLKAVWSLFLAASAFCLLLSVFLGRGLGSGRGVLWER